MSSKYGLILILETATLTVPALLGILGVGCSSPSNAPQLNTPSTTPKTYTTTFPLTENPISEGGNWVGGQSAGGNLWGNVQTGGSMAFGVTEPTQYGDPTAILTGTWSPAQSVTGVVKLNTTPTVTCCHEDELRLRMTIAANSITGYEAYCSVMPDNPYCHIARWNGPNGSYCNIESSTPSTYAANGDVLMATATGTNPTTITMYKNGTQIMQATDTGQNCSPGGPAGPFTSGNPGIGFYDDQDSNWSNFGFSSFSAKDNVASPSNSSAPVSATADKGVASLAGSPQRSRFNAYQTLDQSDSVPWGAPIRSRPLLCSP
jgi:hypothetical protein